MVKYNQTKENAVKTQVFRQNKNLYQQPLNACLAANFSADLVKNS